MFDLNWSDPDVRWLVITNWTLFAVTLACVGIVAYGIAVELWKRLKQRSAATADEHSMMLPDLGLTMADGGEKTSRKPKR